MLKYAHSVLAVVDKCIHSVVVAVEWTKVRPLSSGSGGCRLKYVHSVVVAVDVD